MANNKMIWLGMLVLALVFGMTVVGCDNESTDNGKIENGPTENGNTDPKSLIITLLDELQDNLWLGWKVKVFHVGTSNSQAYSDTGIIAEVIKTDTGWTLIGNLLTVPLYDTNTSLQWTGSGTFDVFMVIATNFKDYWYKIGSVVFSSDTTSITIGDSNLIN